MIGRAFGVYALYRALAGRPLRGEGRPTYLVVTIEFVDRASGPLARAAAGLAELDRAVRAAALP